MAVALRSVSHGGGYGSGAAEPASAVDGDLLVAIVAYFYDKTALTPTLSGSGWTRVLATAGPAAGSDVVLAVFTKTRSGATGTTTVTPGGSGGDYLIEIACFTGADTSSPIDGTPTTYAGNNNPTLPAATVATNGSMLIAAQGCYSTASTAWTASGLTFTYRSSGGPSYELGFATAPANAGTMPAVVGSGGDFQGNDASNSACRLITIKPVGATGASLPLASATATALAPGAAPAAQPAALPLASVVATALAPSAAPAAQPASLPLASATATAFAPTATPLQPADLPLASVTATALPPSAIASQPASVPLGGVTCTALAPAAGTISQPAALPLASVVVTALPPAAQQVVELPLVGVTATALAPSAAPAAQPVSLPLATVTATPLEPSAGPAAQPVALPLVTVTCTALPPAADAASPALLPLASAVATAMAPSAAGAGQPVDVPLAVTTATALPPTAGVVTQPASLPLAQCIVYAFPMLVTGSSLPATGRDADRRRRTGRR